MPTDLKRVVQLNITRNAGTVGRVRVSFGLVYNQVGVIVCFIPWGRAVQSFWRYFFLTFLLRDITCFIASPIFWCETIVILFVFHRIFFPSFQV